MRVYLMRHADATPAAPGQDDAARPLSGKGVAQAERAAHVLAALGLGPLLILSSPRVRAHHTAQIVAAALEAELLVDEAANFDFDATALAAFVGRAAPLRAAFVVGHQPSLSAAMRAVTGADVEMTTAGIARLDLAQRQPPLGTLAWLLSHHVTDALAGGLPR